MTTQKILTVVVPTYNMEKYLRRGLDSLIVREDQMQLLEVLIINDGSKDNSSKIGHEYQDRYPQTFRVIDKENGNYGSCVNRGLKEASGKYIKVLDADDWFDNDIFTRYLDVLNSIDVDLVLNNRQYVHSDGEVVCSETFSLPKDEIFNFYDYHASPSMHDVAYKTENVRKLDYHQSEGVSYTDTQWAFVPMFNVKTAYYTKEWMYKYLVGRQGQTMDKSVRYKSLSHWQVVYGGFLEAFSTKPYRDEAKAWLSDRLMGSINGLYKTFLITLKDEHNEILLKFDKFFKETYPDLYELSNDKFVMSNKCKIRYVRDWRKRGKMNYNNPLIYLYREFLRIRNREKKYE